MWDGNGNWNGNGDDQDQDQDDVTHSVSCETHWWKSPTKYDQGEKGLKHIGTLAETITKDITKFVTLLKPLVKMNYKKM